MSQGTFWTKDFVFCALICFLINLGMYVTMVVVVGYATGTLQASTGLAGLASGAFIIGALIGRLIIGEGVERIGMKRVLIAGVIIFLAAVVLNILFANIVALIVARILQGLGYGFASTSLGTIVALIIPAARKGEGMSYYTMFLTLSTAVGPFIANGLYDGSLVKVLLVSLASLIVSLVLAIALRVPTPPQASAAGPVERPRGLKRFFEPKAVPIGFVTFFMALSFAAVLNFANPFAEERDLAAFSAWLFVVYAVFTVASRPFTGKLFDRFGANVVLYPSFILFAAALLVMALASNGVMLLIVGALMGLGYGTYMSCAQTLAIQVSPIEHTGLATSTFFILMDMGTGVGPSLLGSVAGAIGYGPLYTVVMFVPLIGLVLYFVAHGRKAGKRGSISAQKVSSREAK